MTRATIMETLLKASIDREVDRKYIAKLERDNDKLRRELGKRRLLDDMRADIREAAAQRRERSMFHTPQAG